MHSKHSAASNDAANYSSAVSVAPTQARAEAEAMGAEFKDGRGDGVNIPRSWCTAPGQKSAVDAIGDPTPLGPEAIHICS